MIYKNDNSEKFYGVFCADWECVVRATDAEDAASKGIENAFSFFKKKMNLSPSMNIVCINDVISNLSSPDETYFVYTPKALANAGLHDLSKKYENVITLLKNQNNDSKSK